MVLNEPEGFILKLVCKKIGKKKLTEPTCRLTKNSSM